MRKIDGENLVVLHRTFKIERIVNMGRNIEENSRVKFVLEGIQNINWTCFLNISFKFFYEREICKALRTYIGCYEINTQ